jgi:hypothetical protein
MTVRRPEFDRDVLAVEEARFLQALAKRGDRVRHVSEWRTAEKSDHRRCRLLCARGKRPTGRCTAEQRDKFAPFHAAIARSFRNEPSGSNHSTEARR